MQMQIAVKKVSTRLCDLPICTQSTQSVRLSKSQLAFMWWFCSGLTLTLLYNYFICMQKLVLLLSDNTEFVTARANGTPRRVRPFGARDRPPPFARMRSASGLPPPRRLQPSLSGPFSQTEHILLFLFTYIYIVVRGIACTM